MSERYDRMTGAAIEATNAAPVESLETQRARYDIAKRVADEVGSAVVSVLPVVNGRYHARAGKPPVTPIHDRDSGYAVGYLWTEEAA